MMNANPHTHELKIRRAWSNGSGGFVVEYGDTNKHVWRGPFLQARINRAARLVIKWHDRGSIRAGQKADQLRELNKRLQVNTKEGRWGSE